MTAEVMVAIVSFAAAFVGLAAAFVQLRAASLALPPSGAYDKPPSARVAGALERHVVKTRLLWVFYIAFAIFILGATALAFEAYKAGSAGQDADAARQSAAQANAEIRDLKSTVTQLRSQLDQNAQDAKKQVGAAQAAAADSKQQLQEAQATGAYLGRQLQDAQADAKRLRDAQADSKRQAEVLQTMLDQERQKAASAIADGDETRKNAAAKISELEAQIAELRNNAKAWQDDHDQNRPSSGAQPGNPFLRALLDCRGGELYPAPSSGARYTITSSPCLIMKKKYSVTASPSQEKYGLEKVIGTVINGNQRICTVSIRTTATGATRSFSFTEGVAAVIAFDTNSAKLIYLPSKSDYDSCEFEEA